MANAINASSGIRELLRRLQASSCQRVPFFALPWYTVNVIRSIVVQPAAVVAARDDPEDAPREDQGEVHQLIAEPPAMEIAEAAPRPPWHPITAMLYQPFNGTKNILLMDIEGRSDDCVELTILACEEHIPLEVFHGYGRPNSLATFKGDARRCHGMSLPLLRKLTKLNPSQLLLKGRDFARRFAPATIISNDKSEDSDINTIRKHWGNGFRYRNVFLGDWVERDLQTYHKLALQAKFEEQPVKNVSCPYHQLHSTPFIPYTRPDGTKNGADIARNRAKAHCSLYDVLELFYFVEECMVRGR